MKNLQKAEQIISLALAMRTLQKDYFKTRSKDVLNKAKRMERDLDKKIEEYYDTQIKIDFQNV